MRTTRSGIRIARVCARVRECQVSPRWRGISFRGGGRTGRTYGIGSVVGGYAVPGLGQPCAAVAVKDRPPARRRDRPLVVPRVERLDGAARVARVAERELSEHVGWDRVAQEEREVCERGGAGCGVGGGCGCGRWRWQVRLAWQSHHRECLSPCSLSVSSRVSVRVERRRENAGGEAVSPRPALARVQSGLVKGVMIYKLV